MSRVKSDMSSDGAYAQSGEGYAKARRQSGDSSIGIILFVASIAGALYLAWLHRGDGIVNPERGLGYALGIVGALLMLALLLYPLRKRLRSMRGMGSVATWFRLHMILGVVGPVLVVIHSNFETKSLNAAVALYSMLVVSASGVVGRYFYGRIHRGLYGGRVEARELIAEAQAFREGLGMDLRGAAWGVELAALEREASRHAKGFFSALAQSAALNAHARRSERRLLDEFEIELRERARSENWTDRRRQSQLMEGRARIRTYHDAVRRVAALAVYERLFAAWHVLHLPLFFMLILTALIHVVAVHLY